VNSLNKSLDSIENPVVKGTLKGISLDSIKHAEMYASAINLLMNSSPFFSAEKCRGLRKVWWRPKKGGEMFPTQRAKASRERKND
jgi:hypothetical protein